MIRVHDLSNNMALAGSYDFPEEDESRRRHIKVHNGHSYEAAHLHKIGDYAIALCRAPDLKLFIFRLKNFLNVN